MVLEYGWWEGYVLYDGLVMGDGLLLVLPTSRLGLSLSPVLVVSNLIGYNGAMVKVGRKGHMQWGRKWGLEWELTGRSKEVTRKWTS